MIYLIFYFFLRQTMYVRRTLNHIECKIIIFFIFSCFVIHPIRLLVLTRSKHM